MKKILLTHGQFTLVDDEDYEWLNQWKWCAQFNPKTNSYYAVRSEKNKVKIMSRVIMGEPKDLLVDHRDRNTLNNQRNNLRIATRSQNGRNSKKHRNNTLGFIGIFRKKGSKKWKAHISVNGKMIYLGMFCSKLEAAKRYDDEAKKIGGEFANLNFS